MLRVVFILGLMGIVMFPMDGAPLTRAQAGEPPPALTVVVSDVRNDRGHVVCALFRSEVGFPGDRSRAISRVRASVRGGRAVCTYPTVVAGTYAVAVFHDEDDDDQLDTGMFGIPTEGTTASRDARGSMGPPSFADARFELPQAPTTLRVRMHY